MLRTSRSRKGEEVARQGQRDRETASGMRREQEQTTLDNPVGRPLGRPKCTRGRSLCVQFFALMLRYSRKRAHSSVHCGIILRS